MVGSGPPSRLPAPASPWSRWPSRFGLPPGVLDHPYPADVRLGDDGALRLAVLYCFFYLRWRWGAFLAVHIRSVEGFIMLGLGYDWLHFFAYILFFLLHMGYKAMHIGIQGSDLHMHACFWLHLFPVAGLFLLVALVAARRRPAR